MDSIREREEIEKEEVIRLLREQMRVEGRLVGLYERTAPDLKNKPVRHLLHMIQLDSMKHIDICQTTIQILEGEEVFSEDKYPRARAHVQECILINLMHMRKNIIHI